jgi:hypothetical protein
MVRDLLEGFVCKDQLPGLDYSSLERVTGDYVSDKLRARSNDIVWRLRWGDEWVYVYFLIEFQSTIERYMAVRILTYVGLLYQDHRTTDRARPASTAALSSQRPLSPDRRAPRSYERARRVEESRGSSISDREQHDRRGASYDCRRLNAWRKSSKKQPGANRRTELSHGVGCVLKKCPPSHGGHRTCPYHFTATSAPRARQARLSRPPRRRCTAARPLHRSSARPTGSPAM